jgi:hypothetical protein
VGIHLCRTVSGINKLTQQRTIKQLGHMLTLFQEVNNTVKTRLKTGIQFAGWLSNGKGHRMFRTCSLAAAAAAVHAVADTRKEQR